jgi:tetratricopeptide (TPR) repeat protein
MLDSRVDQLVRQGQAAIQVGNNTLAREYLQAAVDLDPNNVTALLWLAGVQSDDPVRAGATLERVLELDPGNVRAQQGLTYIQEQLSTRREASGATVYSQPSSPAIPQPLAPTTQERTVKPLSIEQELRASLRVDTAARPASTDPAARGARRVVIFSGGDDSLFRILILLLLLSLVAGTILLVFLLL